MTTNTPTASASDDDDRMIPISDLDGAALTKAVRAWARENGHDVADRGAVSPGLILKAALSGATVARASLDTSTVYVLTDTGGNAHTVRGPRGKATLDGLAQSIGLDASDVMHVTRNGELHSLPRRVSAVAVAPWIVTYVTAEGRKETAEYSGGRGRLSVAEVAVAVGVAPLDIISVVRDDVSYVVETTFRFVAV